MPVNRVEHLWNDVLDAPTQALLGRRKLPPFRGKRPVLVPVDLYDLVYDGGHRALQDGALRVAHKYADVMSLEELLAQL